MHKSFQALVSLRSSVVISTLSLTCQAAHASSYLRTQTSACKLATKQTKRKRQFGFGPTFCFWQSSTRIEQNTSDLFCNLIFCQWILKEILQFYKSLTNLWFMLFCGEDGKWLCLFQKRTCALSGDRMAHLPVWFRLQPATGPQGGNQHKNQAYQLLAQSDELWCLDLHFSPIRMPDAQNLIGVCLVGQLQPWLAIWWFNQVLHCSADFAEDVSHKKTAALLYTFSRSLHIYASM